MKGENLNIDAISMTMRVVVDRNEEKKFRRRAMRRMPKEYIELLFGHVHDDSIVICAFVEIDHESTPQALTYDTEDLERQVDLAAKSGLEYLGTIHSHPHRPDTMFSETDARDSLGREDIVFGILAIDDSKRPWKCVTDYWPKVKPFEVEYRKAPRLEQGTDLALQNPI
jgi:proteasome lid subunit RPN8/RPN11